ncbi:hypothetical protein GTU99_18540 [Streptomyces sp. PRKS01-65]|nr:hypothetical protein [Streptomyces harenosi]
MATNLLGGYDVLRTTVRLFRMLLGLLLPSAGRHRASVSHTLPISPRSCHCPRSAVLDGEAVGLVRPYVLAHEHRVEHERRLRRRARLVVAPRGVDLSGEAVA